MFTIPQHHSSLMFRPMLLLLLSLLLEVELPRKPILSYLQFYLDVLSSEVTFREMCPSFVERLQKSYLY